MAGKHKGISFLQGGQKALFHMANPMLRIVVTVREPVARMYSYFSMQLRFGWSPINHMGRNPCMQRRLREVLKAKELKVRREPSRPLNPPPTALTPG